MPLEREDDIPTKDEARAVTPAETPTKCVVQKHTGGTVAPRLLEIRDHDNALHRQLAEAREKIHGLELRLVTCAFHEPDEPECEDCEQARRALGDGK
jgi:hypothetical protein